MGSVYFSPAIKDALDAILLPIEIVSPGKMFGYPAYFVGKKLFACVYEDSVGVKLPPVRVQALLAQEGVAPFIPMGRRVMKEWIRLTREHPAEYQKDFAIFEQSIEYVASLA